ncbi:MAG: c-type cytochrome biogenesis protein CcmI [Alphaproteobacteria bacterium]|nr:c-type cytochrome biogenesis protein CcmI [Alphaproteobacteria bacterium]
MSPLLLAGIAALTVLCALLIIRPLVRRPATTEAVTDPALAVYRHQLAEIARDAESGRLGVDEARAATLEVQRRLLAAADRAEGTSGLARSSGRAGMVVVGIAALGALGLYGLRGSPTLPDLPAAERPAPVNLAEAIAALPLEQRRQAIRDMVDNLATRLSGTPDDVDGWVRLGQSYSVIGEEALARAAFAHAADRAPNRPDVLAMWARSIYPPEAAQAGPPPPQFLALQRRILALDPESPEALWFVAGAEAEAGNRKQAADLLRRLVTLLPTDNPVRPRIEQMVTELDPS